MQLTNNPVKKKMNEMLRLRTEMLWVLLKWLETAALWKAVLCPHRMWFRIPVAH